jgi:hypothetical protein
MTNWKYSVYLADLFQDFYDKDENETATVEDISIVITGIYDRLVMLREEIFKNEDDFDYFVKGLSGLDFIIDDFKWFDTEVCYDDQIEEFDRVMTDLYDFADDKYVWINTSDRKSDGIGKP